MSRDLSAGALDEDRPDDCWSWHPGWYLPGPSATGTQWPGWTPPPHGYVPQGFAAQPLPSSADIQRQVEEVVQRALQTALPAALGATASRTLSPPAPPPVLSSSSGVRPRTENEPPTTTSSPAATTLTAVGLAPHMTAVAHAPATTAPGTTQANPVGGEPYK